MARIRTIKPGFFCSEDVSVLPLRARLTWIGLWTHCDDHGRTKENVKLIKAGVWPLDDVSLRDIEFDLNTLADRRRIVRYEVDGQRFLAITNWHHHQQVNRPQPSKHPAPPVAVGVPEPGDAGWCEDCWITQQSVSNPGGFSDESLRERNKEGKGKDSCASAEEFDSFWNAYPRKVGKQAAWKAWVKAVKTADPPVLIEAAQRYAASRRGEDPKYTAHPTTWLNQGRWEDEPTSTPDGDLDPDAVLGTDYWTPPPPPREIEDDHAARQDWYRQRRAERHTERLAEARRVLASRSTP